MAFVSTDQAREGMVLAERVVDRHGRLLIPAGTALGPRHLSALRIWGVDQLAVDASGGAAEAPPPPDPEAWARAEAHVASLFRHAGDHPFLSALRREVAIRYARDAARSGEPA